jgi:hypothetical protein
MRCICTAASEAICPEDLRKLSAFGVEMLLWTA